jgi:hypothetical protein
MGFGIYEGKRNHLYGDINICMICHNGNVDGWNSAVEGKLIARLNEKGLLIPERNENDLLPRG